MSNRTIPILLGVLALTACGAEEPAGTEVAEPEGTVEAEAPAAAIALPRSAAPEGARAFIVEPADGATLSSPFKVLFGSENIEVLKAGEQKDGSGHHHLLVNAPLPDFGMPIPASDQYRHFGGGQTETELELEPGTYSLQLLFGDYLHIPHDPPIYSEVITVTVE
ncbi:MAG: DUF4399 domain-containing protein [Pseudomonadota bacterium]